MPPTVDTELLQTATDGRILAADPAAEHLLTAAEHRVITALGWKPWPKRTDTAVLDSIETDVVNVPSVLVSDVTEVRIDGRPLPPTYYRWSRSGMVELVHGTFPNGFRRVEVDYLHGTDEIPPAIETIIVALAARSTGSAGQGLTMVRAGQVTEQRSADVAVGGLLGPDHVELGPWKLGAGGFGV